MLLNPFPAPRTASPWHREHGAGREPITTLHDFAIPATISSLCGICDGGASGKCVLVGICPRDHPGLGRNGGGAGVFDNDWNTAGGGRFFSGAERDGRANAYAVVVISTAMGRASIARIVRPLDRPAHHRHAGFTLSVVAPEGFHGNDGTGLRRCGRRLTMYGQ